MNAPNLRLSYFTDHFDKFFTKWMAGQTLHQLERFNVPPHMTTMMSTQALAGLHTTTMKNPIADTSTTYLQGEIVGTRVLDNCSHLISLEIDTFEWTNTIN